MNPKVEEMAVATHGRFWVQHFGKKMPPNKKRKGRKPKMPKPTNMSGPK